MLPIYEECLGLTTTNPKEASKAQSRCHGIDSMRGRDLKATGKREYLFAILTLSPDDRKQPEGKGSPDAVLSNAKDSSLHSECQSGLVGIVDKGRKAIVVEFLVIGAITMSQDKSG